MEFKFKFVEPLFYENVGFFYLDIKLECISLMISLPLSAYTLFLF